MSNVQKLIGDNRNNLEDPTAEEWQCCNKRNITNVADFNTCAHQPIFYLFRVTFISTTYSVRFESSNNNFCLET